MNTFLCKKRKFIIRMLFLLILSLGAIFTSFAQTMRLVSGVIKDGAGESIIGASILVKETKTGTISDIDGRYSVNVPQNATLQISYIGYVTQTASVGNRNQVNITLIEDTQSLEEVIVVGYGKQKKATLTGAISAVTSEEITVTKNENVVNMLTGKLPGVRVSQTSSRPGAFDTQIDIRGMGEPLIVVDGVPRDKDYFSRMDANEIESVSVLKDASAAIYGLRSANGVILVTTKRGESAQGFDVSYSMNYGWQQFLHVPDNVDALQYMTLSNEKNWRDFGSNYMNRKTPAYVDADRELYLNGTKQTTDWMGAIFKTTVPQQQHNLTVNGGAEKVKYFLNLGYMQQDGALRSGSMDYDRWNFRANVDANITKRLKTSLSVGGYMDEMNEPRTDIWAVYKSAWLQKPIAAIYANNNPEYLNNYLVTDGNPIATTNSDITGYRKNINRVFNGQLAILYDIPGVEGLTAKATYNYDFKYQDGTDYKKLYNLYDYDVETGGYKSTTYNTPSAFIQRNAYPNYQTLMQLQLNYQHTFLDVHNVSAVTLYEEGYSSWDNFYAYRELTVNSEYLFAGDSRNQIGFMDKNGIGDRTTKAWVGKLNYDYKGKYLAEFSFRYDGSSKFPKDARWGFFPAGSVGWRISEESFIKNNLPFLNNLKIRGSYGKTADDRDASNYPPDIVGYQIDGNNRGWMYGSTLVGGTSPTAIPNPDLTWYTSTVLDLGVDVELSNGLLGGSIDYFQRDRDGLLATSTALIPGTVGAALPQENLNSDRTSGWEFVLTHRNKISDVSYYVNAQMSVTRNQWKTHVQEKAGNSYDNWRNRVNDRYKDIWWGKTYGGQFTSYDQIYNYPISVGSGGTVPGDYYYVDWNGDGVINGKDDHPIATYGLPLFNYGISLGAEYKGIDLNLHFQGASDVYVKYDEALAEPLSFGGAGTMTKFWDRWHPVDPNDDIFDPSTSWVSGYYPTTGSPLAEGTRSIEDASYIRLKTIELGYTIPKKLLQRLGVKGVRVYFSGYNLLTLTELKNMDPERPGSDTSGNSIDAYRYPVNKTFNIGASIKF